MLLVNASKLDFPMASAFLASFAQFAAFTRAMLAICSSTAAMFWARP